MAGLPRLRTPGAAEEWRQRIGEGLPNEQEFVVSPKNVFVELVDNHQCRFVFDPVGTYDHHECQWSDNADFRDPAYSSTVYPPAKSQTVQIDDRTQDVCGHQVFFRVRAIRNGVKADWSAPAIYSTPVPGALTDLVAFHTIDNPSEENPIINVNITLPRTATIGGRTVSDREADFTDHVELEANWSTLNGGIDNSQTTMDVAAGTGSYFKANGFYKIEDEIIGVVSVATDTVTIERGHFGTTAAAHADLSNILFYARILRDQFHASDKGLYGVTVTIPNPEKVRMRTFVARAVNRCGEAGPDSNYALDLPAPALIVDLVAEPFFQKIVLRWSELAWTAYRYEIFHATTGTVQIADLDPTTTGDCELLARPLADHEGEATYQYDVSYAAGVFHYFGVRAIDILGGYNLPTGGDTVGPVQPDQTSSNPAGDVTGISASEGPATVPGARPPRARGTSGSVITCGFTPPAADPNWARCKIYLQPTEAQATLAAAIPDGIVTTMTVTLSEFPRLAGWQFFQIDSEVVKVTAYDHSTGIATITRGEFGTTPASHTNGSNIFPYVKPVFTGAEGDEAPLVFHWPSIGQVTLYFVSVAADGTENDILSSPNLSIDLDGQVSAPLEVQNLHAIKTIHGLLAVWSDGLEPDLDHYDVADLGSRTLILQTDPDDDQIVARIPASPGDSRRVTYEHIEILFEGTIAQGSSTIVLTGKSIPNDRYKPLGATPVKETVRIVVTDGSDALSHTDYEINSNSTTGTPPNEQSTIVLNSAPTEANSGNISVKFYIGQRLHKIYVRAVNRAYLASEWRPVEGVGNELVPQATAPDGTVDLGVPTIVAPPAFQGAYYTTGRAGVPGNGTIGIHPTAQSDITHGLVKYNISGIIGWHVRVTHTDSEGAGSTVSDFSQDESSREAVVTDGTSPGFVERPASAGYMYVGREFLIYLPNRIVTQVDFAAQNYFGRSDWVTIPFFGTPAGPYYTGNKPVEVLEDITPASAISLDLAKSEVAFIDMQNPVTGITIQGAEPGRRFSLVFIQPAGGPQQVTWNSNFKIDQDFQPLQLASTYTTMKFICRTSSAFYLDGAPVNGPA